MPVTIVAHIKLFCKVIFGKQPVRRYQPATIQDAMDYSLACGFHSVNWSAVW